MQSEWGLAASVDPAVALRLSPALGLSSVFRHQAHQARCTFDVLLIKRLSCHFYFCSGVDVSAGELYFVLFFVR